MIDMKAEELPMSTTAIVIIVIVAVAVLIVFSIGAFSKIKGQSDEYTNLSEESVGQGMNPAEKAIFMAQCDSRCSAAKGLVRSIAPNDCASAVADSNFCEDTIIYNGAPVFCDKFYVNEKANQCTLTFSDASTRTLTCAQNAVEQCS